MAQKSIARRLVLAVVISQLLLAAGVFFVAVYFTHRQLRAAFDSALQGRAMSIAALVHYSEEEHPKLEFQGDLVPPPLEQGHDDLYEVSDNHGNLIARSPNWPDRPRFLPTAVGSRHSDFNWNGVRYRALQLSNVPVLDREANTPPNDYLNVVYASPIIPVARAIGHLRLYIAGGCVLLLCFTVPLAIWGLKRGLRPLKNLASNAALISTSNWQLNPDAEAMSTRELAPLTEAMTAMLDGLHRAFTQQQEFLANAAHELKTPVAVLKSTLQSLLQRPRSSEEYRAGLEQALEDMARLEKLLHSMLRLARAEQSAAGSVRRDLREVDVAATCQAAIDRLLPLARERDLELKLLSNGPLAMRADPEDLELVWSNLLENAVRFSPERGSVKVSLHSNGQRGYVEIADNGPGIPAEELPHIFERFHRGDPSRDRNTGGYGLGLAIAKALIQAYGGDIRPESEPGAGTRMIVSIPIQG
jgi:signal transduction histidine kinase